MTISYSKDEILTMTSRAKEFFSRLDTDRLAIAAKGTLADLVLIHAAAEYYGSGNVFIITADTGFLYNEEVNLIVKACEIENLDYTAITVYIEDEDSVVNEIKNAADLRKFDITHTAPYKHCIFIDMLHEAWLRGYSVLADGCTDKNYCANGNDTQHELNVLSPLASCSELS